ncbi:hypothetical protein LVJ94_33095 [Pendulispora rubella]|uniref:Uncharacterized protein n=1 Tax=Pendulispora rubella TaxID=2741070 RepID=A0ABZ2KXN5_9BACT
MKKSVWALAFVFAAPLFACAAQSDDESRDDSAKVNQSVDVESAAASCGQVTLDFCRDPSFPSQITATCHPQQRCSCAEERSICESLVRENCGPVENIVVSNCN